eukprot:7106203-Prymnesium_polylepis.2
MANTATAPTNRRACLTLPPTPTVAPKTPFPPSVRHSCAARALHPLEHGRPRATRRASRRACGVGLRGRPVGRHAAPHRRAPET